MKSAAKDVPYRRKDVHAEVGRAKKEMRLRVGRAKYATVGFFLSCGLVVPFLEGFPFHSYWQSFGKLFLLISMALLIPFVVIVGLAVDAWFVVRTMEKIEK